MADIELVIKISKEDYESIKDDVKNFFSMPAHKVPVLYKAVNEGTPFGRCKNCKWWKDSDGAYRRGCRAESQCPINRREVFEGNGYCYLYEPLESEES